MSASRDGQYASIYMIERFSATVTTTGNYKQREQQLIILRKLGLQGVKIKRFL